MPPASAEAPRPASRCASVGVARAAVRRRDVGGPARISSTIPPTPTTVNASPTSERRSDAGVRSAPGDRLPGRSRPAMTRDGAPAPDASIARSNAELRRGGVDARPWSARPTSGPSPCRGRSAGRRAATSVAGGAVVEAAARCRRSGAGSRAGRPVGQQVDVGLDALGRRSCRGPRIRSGTHGLSVGIVMWTGVPSPTAWPRVGGRVGIEHGGQEDRDAGGVEVEHLGRVGREAEAVVRGPLADRRRRRPAGP